MHNRSLWQLRCVQALLLAVIVLAFPVAAALVFYAGFDRQVVADVLSCIYAFGLYAVFLSPLLPLDSLAGLSRFQRIDQMVLVWFWVTYITHCTWELGWLVLHDWIINGKDNPLFYTWWAYIDGGDYRYATADITLIVMEILSVTNGVIGLSALYLWFKKPNLRYPALLMFLATAVVHLYSTSLYFIGEIMHGLPNVDTGRFLDVGIKFVLANSPWLLMPLLVIYWVFRQLPDVIDDRDHD